MSQDLSAAPAPAGGRSFSSGVSSCWPASASVLAQPVSAPRSGGTVQAVGDLTLHGVSRSVIWEAEFTRDGEALTGTATTTFVLEDYDMEKPIVGPVVSIGDEILLNVEIVAATES